MGEEDLPEEQEPQPGDELKDPPPSPYDPPLPGSGYQPDEDNREWWEII